MKNLMSLLLLIGGCFVLNAQSVSLDEVITMIYNKQDISGQQVIIDDLYFETASAEISEKSAETLEKISFILHQIPTTQLRIEGHTDNVGDAATNKLLSDNRAKSVKDYLVSKNIFENRLSHIGQGENIPIANNSTSTGKAKNRRVQLVFESMDTRTHYIILRDGNELPVIMVLVYENYLEYKANTSDAFAKIDKKLVEEVRFADGNTLPMRAAAQDSDGDGVTDERDNCPNEYGSLQNSGCPKAKDSDGDGIADEEDNCPEEAGIKANNGCPEQEVAIEKVDFFRDLLIGDALLFDKAIGARFTKGYGISQFKINQEKGTFRELIGLYHPIGTTGEFQFTGLIGKVNTAGRFYWYWGGGIHVNPHAKLEYVEAGIDVIGGLGYNFKNIPLNVSLDFKPAYELYETGLGFKPHISLNSGYGMSIRYILNRKSDRLAGIH